MPTDSDDLEVFDTCCMSCETKDARIAELELALADATDQLTETARDKDELAEWYVRAVWQVGEDGCHISDLERLLAEARESVTEERARGLCDAVDLIVRRAQQSGYAAHATLHEVADEIRERYFETAPSKGRRCDTCLHSEHDATYSDEFDAPGIDTRCRMDGVCRRGDWFCADWEPQAVAEDGDE